MKMSQLFMPPQFDPMTIPVKELGLLRPFIKKENLKGVIFNLFGMLETQQPNMIGNHNRKNFFILNHLLSNPLAITLAKKYLSEWMNSQSTRIDPNYTTYAYVLLDSWDNEGQKLAFAYLDKLLNDPNPNAHNLSQVAQSLLLVSDQHKVSNILQAIFKKLPDLLHQDAWGTLRIVAAFMENPDYHKQALAFIMEILKLKEITGGQSPYTVVSQVLLQNPNTKEFAVQFIEEQVLPHMALKAKHKVQAITSLQGKDREKIVQYLDTIWEVNSSDEDRVQFIADLLWFPEVKDYILPKFEAYLNKFYTATSTLPDGERGTILSNLLNFGCNHISDDHLQSMKDGLINLINKGILNLPHNVLRNIAVNYVIEPLKKLGLNEADFITQYSQSPTADPEYFMNIVYYIYGNNTTSPKYLADVYQKEHTPPQLKAKILYQFARQIGSKNQDFYNLLPKEEITNGLYAILEQDDNFLKTLGLEKNSVFNELKEFMNLNSEG